MTLVDYKLSDLLGIAGATIGIIIAGAILLGGLIGQYTALFERYRALTGEYRDNHASDPRRGSLQNQIANYRLQVRFLNIGSLLVSLALLLFLLTVGVASLSVMFPKDLWLRTAGTACLFGGLLLIFLAVTLQGVAIFMSRHAIGKEVADIADVPSAEETLRK